MSTVLDFLSGAGAQAPAGEAAAPEDDAVADDAAAEDAGAEEATDEDAADTDRNHHRKDDGATDDAPAEDDAAAEDEAPADDGAAEDEAAEDEAPADDAAGDADAAGLSAVEQEIFDTLNATRAEAGLNELTLVADIAAGSRDYACTMAETGVFEHADIAAAGVNGENIAFGQRSAAEVHQGWMDSPGHRDNRMNSAWTEYGVGVCEDGDGRPYYVERFR